MSTLEAAIPTTLPNLAEAEVGRHAKV